MGGGVGEWEEIEYLADSRSGLQRLVDCPHQPQAGWNLSGCGHHPSSVWVSPHLQCHRHSVGQDASLTVFSLQPTSLTLTQYACKFLLGFSSLADISY